MLLVPSNCAHFTIYNPRLLNIPLIVFNLKNKKKCVGIIDWKTISWKANLDSLNREHIKKENNITAQISWREIQRRELWAVATGHFMENTDKIKMPPNNSRAWFYQNESSELISK